MRKLKFNNKNRLRYYSQIVDNLKTKETRYNDFNVQMLPSKMHNHLFPNTNNKEKCNKYFQEEITKAKHSLKKFGLLKENLETISDVDFKLPSLKGRNLEEHFKSISQDQSKVYFELLSTLVKNELPPLPPKEAWVKRSGWTKYVYLNDNSIQASKIECPDSDAYVFDCEVLAKHTNMPIMAIAASNTAWYSWCCEELTNESNNCPASTMENLIPLQSAVNKPKLVIGHNVAYDRARVKEEYMIELGPTQYFDTMSMHIAVSGFNNAQRLTYKSIQSLNKFSVNNIGRSKSWMRVGCANSLSELYKFYCNKEIDKSLRDVFVKGDMNEVRNNFSDLMWYCAKDVGATHEVLVKLTPQFLTRFPHPVTFSGMLLMSKMFLPVELNNWGKYLNSCQQSYQSLMLEIQNSLVEMADDGCRLFHNKNYKLDPWLWNLDWSVKETKLLKNPRKGFLQPQLDELKVLTHFYDKYSLEERKKLGKKLVKPNNYKHINKLLLTSNKLPKIKTTLSNYPEWYKNICRKEKEDDWKPGPVQVTTLMKITPKLMRLTWLGMPLHFDKNLGWGYLKAKSISKDSINDEFDFSSALSEIYLGNEYEKGNTSLHTPRSKTDSAPESMDFHRLPHPNGTSKNVGNPLSKDFLEHAENGDVLGSADFDNVARFLEINKMCSYWRSARTRIQDQFLLPMSENSDFGAIAAQVVVSGTVSRRAVEKTWLTASNARSDRIGSELKSLVQAPQGWKFVGADVDSEELWIASLFADSMFLGWLNLDQT